MRGEKKPPDDGGLNNNHRDFSISNDTIGGTYFDAGAAAGADIGINYSDIALFADRIDRAFGFTSAAVDAIFFIDDVSHVLPPYGIFVDNLTEGTSDNQVPGVGGTL